MGDDHTRERLSVAREIVEIFKLERYCYLALTLVTAAIVIAVGLQAILKNSAGTGTLTLLFGSGGVVAFNIGRLLKMFNTVIEKVFKDVPNGGTNHAGD